MSTLSPPSPGPAVPSPEAARGAWASAACYVMWGLVPLYWKQLAGINPVELIAHRHVWSLLLVLGVLATRGRLTEIGAALATPRDVGRNLLSASLLTGNWLVYVWGVNTGRVVETSLGYFLVPLLNVALGRVVLGERLRRVQWFALALAALGVAFMATRLDRLPWIALALAGTWAGYGFMRKRSTLGSLTGLTVETLLLAPFALAFLWWQHQLGVGAWGRSDAGRHCLLMAAGLITALPLLLFAYGARRIRLTTLGVLQYLAPTVQFALGVWHYHEPLARERWIGFGFIWAGLLIYTAESLVRFRRAGRANAQPGVPPPGRRRGGV